MLRENVDSKDLLDNYSVWGVRVLEIKATPPPKRARASKPLRSTPIPSRSIKKRKESRREASPERPAFTGKIKDFPLWKLRYEKAIHKNQYLTDGQITNIFFPKKSSKELYRSENLCIIAGTECVTSSYYFEMVFIVILSLQQNLANCFVVFREIEKEIFIDEIIIQLVENEMDNSWTIILLRSK